MRNKKEHYNEQFEEIYSEYKNSIMRACYMILKDFQLAEDATQETFIKVYRKLHTFKAQSEIKTWITSIAINVCKSKMRINSYSKEVSSDTVALHNSMGELKPENKMVITQTVMSLPQQLREVTVLFYYQELKHSEIAKILKIPKTTVDYRLRKAREYLKNNIKEDLLYE